MGMASLRQPSSPPWLRKGRLWKGRFPTGDEAAFRDVMIIVAGRDRETRRSGQAGPYSGKVPWRLPLPRRMGVLAGVFGKRTTVSCTMSIEPPRP